MIVLDYNYLVHLPTIVVYQKTHCAEIIVYFRVLAVLKPPIVLYPNRIGQNLMVWLYYSEPRNSVPKRESLTYIQTFIPTWKPGFFSRNNIPV